MADSSHGPRGFPDHNVSSLRTRILRLRVPIDSGGSYLIPQGPLEELMTREIVRDAISACGKIERYQVEELVDFILRGAIKVFAILVLLKGEEELILRFVESDGFQKAALDARLPFHRSQIEALVPEETVEDFDDRQWEFIIPFFSKAIIHRVMVSRTRLPFTLDKDTGKEGGFGRIHEIQIHPEYHDFSLTPDGKQHLRLVRKEFFPNSADEQSFKREIDNLNILNQIKHPNIIELFGSYTYRGRHNALFPLAIGGDLATFMGQATRQGDFTDDCNIYRALSELASAVEVLHHYTAKSIDLTLIGVHHDLKPQNVLVHDGTFVLADFGLTKFKSADQTSQSLFKIGGGHFLAPECEDYEDGFKKNSVGRSSDIWSFGCILAEMVTYMCHGADGVQAFKAARKVKVAGFTTYTFHAGLNSPNPGVVEWLSKLEHNFQEILMIDLIQKMLNVNPSLRPSSAYVTMFLRLLTIQAYTNDLLTQFDTLTHKHASHELEAQQWLFAAWHETLGDWSENLENGKLEAYVAHVDEDNHNNDSGLARWLCTASQTVIQRAEEMRREMKLIALRYKKATSPLFHNLRNLNEGLIDLLPAKFKRQAYSRFELSMMRQVDATIDDQHQDLLQSQDTHSRKLTMLTTMRRLNRMTLDSSTTNDHVYYLTSDTVHTVKRFGDHMLGVLRESPEAPEKPVLIEQLQYDTHWEGAVSKEMFTRMTAMARVLEKLAKPGNLPILTCKGFYHMPARFSFGIVFECPFNYRSTSHISQSACSDVTTLAEVIQETNFTSEHPPLDDRYYLAHLLVSTLLDFHKAGWLHKSISPYNVILFRPEGSSGAESLRRPFLIGFNRSRQDLATAFTEGVDTAPKSMAYTHMLYLKSQCRFRRAFDYYSLGIVLLEIGLWRPLSSILHELEIRPPKMSETVLKKLLIDCVPLLSYTMGVDYYIAVRECLSWDATIDDASMTQEERSNLLLKFERLVVESISRCSLSEKPRDFPPRPFPTEQSSALNTSSLHLTATAPGATQILLSKLERPAAPPQTEVTEDYNREAKMNTPRDFPLQPFPTEQSLALNTSPYLTATAPGALRMFPKLEKPAPPQIEVTEDYNREAEMNTPREFPLQPFPTEQSLALNTSPHLTATAPGAPQILFSKLERPAPPQTEVTEDYNREAEEMNTPRARLEPFQPEGLGLASSNNSLSSNVPEVEPEPAGFQTPKPSTFVPQPATAAQLMDREYRERHHLGLRGFDDPDPESHANEDPRAVRKSLARVRLGSPHLPPEEVGLGLFLQNKDGELMPFATPSEEED